MGKLNRMKNQYVKGQMEKLSSGGDLVSDAEKTGFQTQATEQANQAIGVQQQGLNRMVMGQTGGSPLAAGALAGASKQLGGTSGEAAAKATGQTQQLSAALRERRKAEILNQSQIQLNSNRAKAQQIADISFAAADVASEIGTMGMGTAIGGAMGIAGGE